MAFNTNNTQEQPSEAYALARYGISLIINNKALEAQELFKSNSNSIQMSAGYSFALFIDALLSFEEDKILLALTMLRETEKQCAGEMGWLKNVKTKMFGQNTQSLAERLESQIILADTQVCVALVTFLQQEFTGFLKGGWVLRKAWKLYQHTYGEILELYKKQFGEFNLPEPTDFQWIDNSQKTTSSISTEDASSSTTGSTEWVMPDSSPPTPSKQSNGYGYAPISSPIQKLPQSQSTFQFPKSSSMFSFSIRRSGSAHSSLNKTAANNNRGSSYSFWSPIASQLSYLGSTLSLLTSSEKEDDEIEPEVIARLMGAVCFGYGALQLGMSLLPPSLSKVSNFLGFNGNRMIGISNLMYARKGSDMRAPLAMLALLWYHTIVRPFFALDGSNVKAGIESAELLMQESVEEYPDSALFWFFRGRIHRLNSNIALALESFQATAYKSPQREIKLLAYHEVAWCYLIQLDFERAQKVFINLKRSSRWSKLFYAFLAFICAGTYNQNELPLLVKMRDAYAATTAKSSQLDMFLRKRLNLFPSTDESLQNTSSSYWKFFAYEILFLWNALPSCDTASLDIIVNDCNESVHEPMPGLAMFLQGECYTILGSYENAVVSFKKCIEIRSHLQPVRDDVHISANTEYSLGLILVKQSETKDEGKELLIHASQYKDFDFDNKLLVRINQAIKNVS